MHREAWRGAACCLCPCSGCGVSTRSGGGRRGGPGPGSPRRGRPLTSVRLVSQLDHIDPRAVQLGSLLVRGLTTLVLVNSACGFPWRTSELMPWNVFDGKLFHEKYLQSARGCSAEALVEQNVSVKLPVAVAQAPAKARGLGWNSEGPEGCVSNSRFAVGLKGCPPKASRLAGDLGGCPAPQHSDPGIPGRHPSEATATRVGVSPQE